MCLILGPRRGVPSGVLMVVHVELLLFGEWSLESLYAG